MIVAQMEVAAMVPVPKPPAARASSTTPATSGGPWSIPGRRCSASRSWADRLVAREGRGVLNQDLGARGPPLAPKPGSIRASARRRLASRAHTTESSGSGKAAPHHTEANHRAPVGAGGQKRPASSPGTAASPMIRGGRGCTGTWAQSPACPMQTNPCPFAGVREDPQASRSPHTSSALVNAKPAARPTVGTKRRGRSSGAFARPRRRHVSAFGALMGRDLGP
jgi:hypothetical protein